MTNFHNNGHLRVKLTEFDDSGKQQVMRTQGRVREQLGGTKHMAHKLGMHGVISVPWKGSLGYAMPIGSNPDQTLLAGFEHPDKRFRNAEEGDAGCYRDQENYLIFKNNKVYLKTQYEVIVESDVKITLKAPIVIIDSPDIRLGGADASRPVAAEGTVDNDSELNGPDALVGNFLNTVKGK